VSLIGLAAFGLACWAMGRFGIFPVILIVLPLGVWAGIIAAKADGR